MAVGLPGPRGSRRPTSSSRPAGPRVPGFSRTEPMEFLSTPLERPPWPIGPPLCREAASRGLAPDGGLYMPASVPDDLR